tara:strand:+ start:1206 stop:1904 length:699 start_codon:yes stop_codon:yes gene_type:complete
MSVNVNTVYSRVLAILNKEQRGFLTPQEFNLFANQAQMDLFEQYFYDINQFSRIPGNSTEFSDMLNILNEKIAPFIKESTLSTFAGGALTRPADFYRLGNIRIGNVEAQRLNRNEYLVVNASPLTTPSTAFPVFFEKEHGFVVYDGSTAKVSGVFIDYIKRPVTVQWGGVNVNGVPQYSSAETHSTNFELHSSEETELVIKILELAGVLLKQLEVTQYAGQKEAQGVQQEKA